jgi:hypothetical protein
MGITALTPYNSALPLRNPQKSPKKVTKKKKARKANVKN